MRKPRTGSALSAPPPVGRKLGTVAEVCAYLKINRTTLWRYVDAGKIKTYRLSRSKTMVDLDSVDAFVNGHVNSRAKKTA